MERRALSPERRAEVIRRRDAYEAGFRRAIRDGVAAGELRPVDERLASIALLSICNWFTQWYRPDGPMTPDEIADVFTSLSFDGLRTRGESNAPLPAPPGGGARRPSGAA
jgi:hypothetical protein